MKRSLGEAEIKRAIRQLALDGFGGACFNAAQIINAEVFGGKGRIVAAANKFWLEKGRFIGHVAVLYNETYWDADAKPKEWEDIEAWGMLDPEDPDYEAPGWSEEAAYEVKELSRVEIMRVWEYD